MTQPWPITQPDVEGYLGTPPAGTADALAMTRAAEAVTAWCERHGLVEDPAPTEVSADVHLGAVMLAGRWYGRRTSVNGIAGFGDVGVAYVIRQDPDVASLLGLGRPGIA